MDKIEFERSLLNSLDDLGLSASRFKSRGKETTFFVNGRTPVDILFNQYEGEVDVFVSVGNRRKVVSMWNSQPNTCAEAVAQCINLLASMPMRRNGYRLKSASSGLNSKQARIIALSMQPLVHGEGRTAANIASVIKRITKLVQSLSREPRAWRAFKEAVGAKGEELSATQLGKMVWDWATKGKKLVKGLVGKIINTFPLSLYFVPKNKVPTLTDLLNYIFDKAPDGIKKALRSVKDNVVQPLSDLLDKYLPTLRRPLIAAIFAWIWINVAEISWDFKDLIRGFTGAMSLAELFSTLPESSIGFIFAMFGVGYHLLPVMVMARIIWLVANEFLDWKGGKIVVRWDRLGVPNEKPLVMNLT